MAPPSANSIPTARKTGGGGRHPHEPALRCPRCDSTNTKFCYYNNYSLAQPRHFCKTCRRYWTLGGSLRNVPIGGGCRKTKKPKPSISLLSGDTKGLRARPPGTGGLEFFHTLSPAVDIQMGGHDFPGIPPESDLPGPFPSAVAGNHWVAAGFQEMGGLNCQNSLITSSIESLSFINQDLHWKLQRQRLSTLFSGDDGNQKKALVPNQKNQPALFQDMDISKKPDLSNRGFEKNNEGGLLGINIHNIGLNSTDWFFDNSYQTVAPAAAPVSGNVSGSTSNWSNGIQDLY